MNEILPKARKEKRGIALFNIINLEMARAIIKAAEDVKAPVIIGTAERLLDYIPLEHVADILIPMAKRSKVPVVVHFDHCVTKEKCIEALSLGFTSVMFDCSKENYEENIFKMRSMVDIAHSYEATIEGELGSVLGDEGAIDGIGGDVDIKKYYTNPDIAKEYIEKTNVDALAIAVGTSHGQYNFEPKLDFDRIKEIRDIVSTPLVLHGGSGLADNDFIKAIENGISKINIFTEINLAAAESIKHTLCNKKSGIDKSINPQIEEIYKVAYRYISLFYNRKIC